MKKKHIIFDFDGTIFDSNRVIVASWQEVFRHYTGKEGRVEDIYHTFGETIRYTVKKFFPQANVDEAVQIYRNYQQAHYDGMVGLFDGTREMMDRMVEGGHIGGDLPHQSYHVKLHEGTGHPGLLRRTHHLR